VTLSYHHLVTHCGCGYGNTAAHVAAAPYITALHRYCHCRHLYLCFCSCFHAGQQRCCQCYGHCEQASALGCGVLLLLLLRSQARLQGWHCVMHRDGLMCCDVGMRGAPRALLLMPVVNSYGPVTARCP
jgi:hypothetical protein